MIVSIDEHANGQTVALHVGQILALALPENRTSGFRWALTADGAPVCRLVADVFEPAEPAGTTVGRGGVHRWRFEAVAAGEAQVVLEYRRAWEAQAPPARTFTLVVSVRGTP